MHQLRAHIDHSVDDRHPPAAVASTAGKRSSPGQHATSLIAADAGKAGIPDEIRQGLPAVIGTGQEGDEGNNAGRHDQDQPDRNLGQLFY